MIRKVRLLWVIYVYAFASVAVSTASLLNPYTISVLVMMIIHVRTTENLTSIPSKICLYP